MAKVIITGGTGLVGRQLSEMLKEKGHEVAILTRNPTIQGEYKWDVAKNYIDPQAFINTQIIIHLAGTGVADKPWSDARKKEILDSRTKSAAVLFDHLKIHPHTITSFISAAAVGYYGDANDALLTESAVNGTGFLAAVCRQWEATADHFSELGIRVCKLRIGIVLSAHGGALSKMDLPVRFGIGTYFGDGKQYVPWIHIKDVCRMFIHVADDQNISGVFNACAPHPVTNKDMTKAIAGALNRPFIPLPAPAFALKMILGERAQMLLMSNRCTSDKIQQTGFRFRFTELETALRDIYQK